MPRWTRLLQTVGPLRILTGLGMLFVGIGAGRAILELVGGGPISAALDGFVLIGGPGTVLLYGRYWLPRSDIRLDVYPRVVAWSLGGLGLMLTVVGLIEINPTGGIDQPFFTPFIATGLGSVGGLAIGVNEARAISRAREVEHQRDELRYERDLRERILETSPVGIAVVNTDRSVAAANDHAAEIIGLPREDLLALEYDESLFEATDADGNPIDDGVFQQVLTTGEGIFDVERQLTRPDGRRIWLSVSAAPLSDPSGTVTGVIFAFEDITGRKEREQQLDQYKTVADTASEAIVTIDTHSEIQSVNPAVEHVFGYDPDELVGESLTVLMPEGLREEHVTSLQTYLVTGEKHLDWEYIELPGMHKQGHEVPLAISFSEYEHDRERFFTGIIRDNTERKQLEADLKRTVESLEQSNDRLRQFAYAASHDLREPLRMVSSYLQLIEDRYDDELDEAGREFIDFAVDGADRMREMVEDLLAYSRVEQRDHAFESVDCDAVVEQALDDLRVQIKETNADIRSDPLPTIVADEHQLEQLFQNLLSNALKYRGDEPPRVEISAEQRKGQWEFRIADNGIGINPEQTDRIFEVFKRLHSDEEYAGTGIGLSLCQKIVNHHGGRIWVDSTPGEGSTFYFTIPLAEQDRSPVIT